MFRVIPSSIKYFQHNPNLGLLSLRRMSIERQEVGDRMSKIVKHKGPTIYLCGQVAEDSSASIAEQTSTMLNKVDSLLTQAGSDREDILSATIYLKSMDDFAAMNNVWESWIPQVHS